MIGNDARFLEAVSKKRFNEVEILFPLVSKGVKRQYITGDEFNPLHYASSPEIVRFLISSGIDVNVKNPETDETPLMTVIKLSKSPKVVRELLNYGASLEARNKYSMNTPLNQATLIPECPVETVQVLLENGAVANTANKYCDTPLHNACRMFKGGDLKIIELLLKFGSPVNFRNFKGDTPLNISFKNSHCTAELIRTLLKFNAKVTVETFEHAQEIHYSDLNIITELLQNLPIACEYWARILQHVLRKVTNEQKLLDCGRLIIKYSFLQCDDPHLSFVRTINGFEEFIRNTSPFSHNLPVNKTFIASVTRNLKSFCDGCFSEIKHMKTHLFENNISVYELIISKTKKFSLDSKVLNLLKKNTYPIYANMILNKIKRDAVLDKLFLQQIYTIVHEANISRRVVLDVFSVGNIAKYLSVDEIKNFVEAFCNPSKCEYCFWDNLVEIEDNLATRPYHSVSKKKKAPIITHLSSKVQKKTFPRI